MSLTKLSLAGNILIITSHGEFGYSDVPAGGDGNIAHLFYSVVSVIFKAVKLYFFFV
jgi:hypothetical protein